MAMFHFRINSDKKPDGSKISAVKHVDYIRREGAFSDFDRAYSSEHFSGNSISSARLNMLAEVSILCFTKLMLLVSLKIQRYRTLR